MSRILPRFTQQAIEHDPLEIAIAQAEARTLAAQDTIAAGTWLAPNPQDLRGIPCIANGVGGTSPGTDPLQTLIAKERRMAA